MSYYYSKYKAHGGEHTEFFIITAMILTFIYFTGGVENTYPIRFMIIMIWMFAPINYLLGKMRWKVEQEEAMNEINTQYGKAKYEDVANNNKCQSATSAVISFLHRMFISNGK